MCRGVQRTGRGGRSTCLWAHSLTGAHQVHPDPHTAPNNPHRSTHTHMPRHLPCSEAHHPYPAHMHPHAAQQMQGYDSAPQQVSHEELSEPGKRQKEKNWVLRGRGSSLASSQRKQAVPKDTRWFVRLVISSHPTQALARMLRESRQRSL